MRMVLYHKLLSYVQFFLFFSFLSIFSFQVLPWGHKRFRSRSLSHNSEYKPPPRAGLHRPSLALKSKIKQLKNNGGFVALDQRAVQTPREKTTTVALLGDHLASIAPTPLELVRAIFTWIAKHISYDVALYRHGELMYRESGKEVLERRKAVCEGYASLFYELCNHVGIECWKVGGVATGSSFDAALEASDLDHAWNCVELEGAHFLVDCCCKRFLFCCFFFSMGI